MTENDLDISLDILGAKLTQDLFDFKTQGIIGESRLTLFRERIAEYSRLQKKKTKEWQEKRGYSL